MSLLDVAAKEAKKRGVPVEEVLRAAARQASGPPAVAKYARIPADVVESIKAEAATRGMSESEVIADRCRRAPAAITKHVKNVRG